MGVDPITVSMFILLKRKALHIHVLTAGVHSTQVFMCMYTPERLWILPSTKVTEEGLRARLITLVYIVLVIFEMYLQHPSVGIMSSPSLGPPLEKDIGREMSRSKHYRSNC